MTESAGGQTTTIGQKFMEDQQIVLQPARLMFDSLILLTKGQDNSDT